MMLAPVLGNIDAASHPGGFVFGYIVQKRASAAALPGRPAILQCNPIDIMRDPSAYKNIKAVFEVFVRTVARN